MKLNFAFILASFGLYAATPLAAADPYGPSSVSAPQASSSSTASSGKNAGPVAPKDESLGATLAVGYESEYYFNGRGIAKDLVFTSLDWSTPLTDMFSVNLGAWYGHGDGDFSNLNLSAGVSANLGPVTVGVRYRWIDIISPPDETPGDILQHSANEIGLTLDSKIGPVNLNVAGYYDTQTDGFYFEAGANGSIKITDWLSLVPGVAVGLNSHYYEIDGFSHVRVSLAAPITLTKWATLTPFIAGNLTLDKLKHLEPDEVYGSTVYGGVTLSVRF